MPLFFSRKEVYQIFLTGALLFHSVFQHSSPLNSFPSWKLIHSSFCYVFQSGFVKSYLHRTTIFLANHVPPILQWLLEAFQPSLPKPHTSSHVHSNQTYFAQWCQQGISIWDLREPRCIWRERLWTEKQELMWFFLKLQLKGMSIYAVRVTVKWNYILNSWETITKPCALTILFETFHLLKLDITKRHLTV